jgi:methionine biosynthesis protein MetW
MIDDPQINDNRAYEYTQSTKDIRLEYPIISNWIKPNSKVIDFGCGDCSLLFYLRNQHNITGIGYDVSKTGIERCVETDFIAACEAIDKQHPELEDQSFDYAICNVTIQMIMYPEILFSEMKRVSRFQIISFPNFAYFQNRLDFILRGSMPKPMLFGYTWYSTGHIHQLSVRDFYDFLALFPEVNVLDEFHLCGENVLKKYLVRFFPNLFSQVSLFLLSENA